MYLINITLILLALFLLSSLIGALSLSDKEENFARTIRRGFSTLLIIAVLIFVGMVILKEPEFIDRVIDILDNLFIIH